LLQDAIISAWGSAKNDAGYIDPESYDPDEMADAFDDVITDYFNSRASTADTTMQEEADAMKQALSGLTTDQFQNVADNLGEDFSLTNVLQTQQYQQGVQLANQLRSSKRNRAAQNLEPAEVRQYTGTEDLVSNDRLEDRIQAMTNLVSQQRDQGAVTPEYLSQVGIYDN
jgi:hypothetical protein